MSNDHKSDDHVYGIKHHSINMSPSRSPPPKSSSSSSDWSWLCDGQCHVIMSYGKCCNVDDCDDYDYYECDDGGSSETMSRSTSYVIRSNPFTKIDHYTRPITLMVIVMLCAVSLCAANQQVDNKFNNTPHQPVAPMSNGSIVNPGHNDHNQTTSPLTNQVSDDTDRPIKIARPSWLKPRQDVEEEDEDEDDDDQDEDEGNDDDEEEEEEEDKVKNATKHNRSTGAKKEKLTDNGDDDDDEQQQPVSVPNMCTAGYFFDRIIPEDYPHEISKDVKHINETIERLNRMYTFSNQMMERLSPFIREMVSRMTDYIYESQLDSECMGALFRVFRAINQRKQWAMNFLDASGSVFAGGFQQGMFVSLGEFDQCLEIESDPSEDSYSVIYGQYCLLKPVVPLPEHIEQGEPIAQSRIPRVNKFLNDEYIDTYLGLYKFMKRTFLRVGLCLPHKCERQSLENAINRILVRKTGMSVQVGPECVKATDTVQMNMHQIVSLTILLLLIVLVVLSTIYEIIYRHMLDNRLVVTSDPVTQSVTDDQPEIHREVCKPLVVQLLTSFSIIRNTRQLFERREGRYGQLDTMRLLLIMFFFVTNCYYYTLVYAPMIIKRFYVQGPMQFVTEKKYFFIRMYYLIDCFVVFTGIALAVSFRPTGFVYVRYLARNYVRYALPVMLSIAIIYLVPLFGSGPLWHLFDQTMTQPCKVNIWSTLLFTNNFNDNIEEICNLPTVFVSMIMQLKVFVPLILMLNSMLDARTGTIFHMCLLLVSTIGNVIYRYYYEFKVPYEYRTMKSFIEIKQSVMFYFFNPLSHVQPLIIGLMVGHWINHQQERESNTRKNRWRNALTGVICMASFMVCFIYTENLNLMNPSLGTMQVLLMLTIGRVMLVSLHCWIIYASINGHITIVNRFLCSIAFRPMSQLSYGFFLSSITVTCYRLFSIRQTIILSGQTMFRSIVSDAVISFLFSYLMHVLVQQPFRNMVDLNLHWPKLLFPMLDAGANSTWSEHSYCVSDDYHHGSYLPRSLSQQDLATGQHKQRAASNGDTPPAHHKQNIHHHSAAV